MTLLAAIETFCHANAIPEYRFGMDALGDPNLVEDLRNGRELRRSTADRVRQFMAARRASRPVSNCSILGPAQLIERNAAMLAGRGS